VLDLSHQKDVEQAKLKVETKKTGDALEGLKVASADNMKLTPVKVPKRKKWKKPKDKPKRPLSAYNLFFQYERERLLHGDDELSPVVAEAKSSHREATATDRKSDGRIGFAALAKEVASKWRVLEPGQKQRFEKEAEKEKERYRVEIEEWKKNQARREQEAQEWSARREDVIRSLSGMASEHERTERALQATMSMQPSFGDTGSLSQRYLERTYNDAMVNQLHTQQMNQYDQLLLNDSYTQQLLMQQERALTSQPATNPQESALGSLQESPMDFYSRMIYAGTTDVTAADAMHTYLSAQYAAAGRSLGVSTDVFPAHGQSAPMISALSDTHLSPGSVPTSASLPARRFPEGLPAGVGAQLGYSTESAMQRQPERNREEQHEMRGDAYRQQEQQQQNDEDDYYNAMSNLRRGTGGNR